MVYTTHINRNVSAGLDSRPEQSKYLKSDIYFEIIPVC